jgi:hypothetical protein
MDPRPLSPSEWDQLTRALALLSLFVAFGTTGSLALLLGYAMLPSLVASADVRQELLRLRRVLLPLGILALVLMLVALWQALVLGLDVVQRIYPRFAV